MNFASDNNIGASPQVLDAIVAANGAPMPAYGADPLTAAATTRLAELFERDIAVFLVATGTAANALALGALCPPWGAVFCHRDAHVLEDECGAPEMFTAGAKLVGIAGEAGKIAPAGLAETLARFPRGVVKQVQPAVLSLSQLTEAGTAYSIAEITSLADLAQKAGLAVHMDGARFANALVSLNCSPADMSWRAGIDVLSFGATKNGGLACEAVIFFDPAKAQTFAFQRKRAGHTLSKGRFLGAQMLAYLADDHWLSLARRANAHAATLETALGAIPGVRFPWRRDGNELFPILPRPAIDALRAAGAYFYDWSANDLAGADQPRVEEAFVRLITSFATPPDDIARFVAIVQNAVT